jgi:RNA polymerase sigma-70 factor (ECF subfamily)
VSIESAPATRLDPVSRRWIDQLRVEHPRREQTAAQLHDLLHRAAVLELRRRQAQRPVLLGPELDDLAQQCADDAVVNVLAHLDDFQGLSRFTTWAYAFAVFEVSTKLARHAWQRHPPTTRELDFSELPDSSAERPGDRLEAHEQLHALRHAIDDGLTVRQREVFVAIALNDVAIDVLALQLNTNRNAIYKNLFDARRKLRALLAAAGHPLEQQP